MGIFDMDISELTRELEKLENIDTIAPEMINAGLDILKQEIEKGYEVHKGTGQLKESIEMKGAKENNLGYYGYVAPQGEDSRGVRNGEKAAYLEYGTWKQASTPVVAPAVASCEQKVVSAMKDKFEEAMGR